MEACTGWSWLVLWAATCAGFMLGVVLIGLFRCQAYRLGYEDAKIDFGIPD